MCERNYILLCGANGVINDDDNQTEPGSLKRHVTSDPDTAVTV